MPSSPVSPRRDDLPAGILIEGHAIVSADGMIAAADGSMPAALRNDADWRQFQAALDASALVVVGRLGHENHLNPGRRRLVFTSRVAALAPDPLDPRATLFNPAGASLPEALAYLGIELGTVAVTGGTRVFDYFRQFYSAFALAEAPIVIGGGRPCFSGAHPRAALAGAGLVPAGFSLLDAGAGVTLTRWARSATAGSPG